MSTEEINHDDLFDDLPSDNGAASATPEAEITTDTPADAEELIVTTEDNKGADENEDASGTPTEGEETAEDNDVKTNSKMIPEHRFKAALKQVNDELTQARQELATLKQVPVPDKATDPEGYDLHVRMEASKAIMVEMKPDYAEVIKHYKVLADANPEINVATSKHPIPAKFAYDLAKRDLEIRQIEELKNSPDWAEFQAWKNSGKNPKTPGKDTSQVNVIAQSLSKVPNLNRVTNVQNKASAKVEDDGLFDGAL